MADILLDPFWDCLNLDVKDDEGRLSRSVLVIGGVAWCVPRVSEGDRKKRKDSSVAMNV